MPIRRMRFVLGAALMFFGVCPLLAACDYWALSVNGDGLLFIAVIDDGTGQGGFRVRARESDGTSRIMDVPPSGNLSLNSLGTGQIELTLLAPARCSVTAPNPRTLSVSAGNPVNVGFEVHCS
jgi:hypothetical protein